MVDQRDPGEHRTCSITRISPSRRSVFAWNSIENPERARPGVTNASAAELDRQLGANFECTLGVVQDVGLAGLQQSPCRESCCRFNGTAGDGCGPELARLEAFKEVRRHVSIHERPPGQGPDRTTRNSAPSRCSGIHDQRVINAVIT